MSSNFFLPCPELAPVVRRMDSALHKLSNISVKYCEKKSVFEEVSKIGADRIEIGRLRCGLGFYCYTHALTQKDNLAAYA